MTQNPFATPESARSSTRRLRGRFASTVTLWTAPGPAGLTMSSTLIVDGEPGRLIGVLDEESELWTAIERHGVFAVSLLKPSEQQLADRFAGLLPAPGGLFRQGESWQETAYGPILANHEWAGCTLDNARPLGWSLLIEATLQDISLDHAGSPLLHHRGTYRELDES